MTVKVLMIALNRSFLSFFEQTSGTYEVYLLEEKELYEADPGFYNSSCIREIRFGEYQQSDGFMEQVLQWHQQIGFDLVLPGLEYSVRAAFRFAAKIGKVMPGEDAVTAFTNKYDLRMKCRQIGVPQPRFSLVETQRDIESFFCGAPIVLKPTNRRASVGVVRIDRAEDIPGAWQESREANEGKKVVSRALTWQYMVEDYMGGYEVSLESFVAEGKPCFHNVTFKETIGGRYFAEVGHTVPAFISEKDRSALIEAKETMLRGLSVRAGLFHSEWKMSEDGPKLIECAARAPGDLIMDLIQAAYEFNPYEIFVQILRGQVPKVPQTNSKVAAVRYFKPTPGKFIGVKGPKLLETLPQIIKYSIPLQQGQMIGPIKDSWSRAGYYAVRCNTLTELTALTNRIQREVYLIVE